VVERSTGERAVFDASVFVRALIGREPTAASWLRRLVDAELVVSVPDLVHAEVANALLQYVKDGTLSLRAGQRRLEFCRSLPLTVYELGSLVGGALGYAERHELSVYDACYAVLAEVEDAVLVTADRRLAGTSNSPALLP
jgi:predicted nucleic acid-binding protein